MGCGYPGARSAAAERPDVKVATNKPTQIARAHFMVIPFYDYLGIYSIGKIIGV
jgi:hypothetical protein